MVRRVTHECWRKVTNRTRSNAMGVFPYRGEWASHCRLAADEDLVPDLKSGRHAAVAGKADSTVVVQFHSGPGGQESAVLAGAACTPTRTRWV